MFNESIYFLLEIKKPYFRATTMRAYESQLHVCGFGCSQMRFEKLTTM